MTEEERRIYARKAAALYRKRHPDRVAMRRRQYARANAEKIAAYQRAYRERNKDKLAEHNKNYHRSHVFVRDKARDSATHRKWRERNPGASAVRENRRRAKQLAAPGMGISQQQRSELIAAACGICAYCNAHRPLTLDHIVPLATGGEHDIENAAAICRRCNSAKRTKSLLRFLCDRATFTARVA